MKYFQVVSLMMNVFNTATVNNPCFSFFFFSPLNDYKPSLQFCIK